MTPRGFLAMAAACGVIAAPASAAVAAPKRPDLSISKLTVSPSTVAPGGRVTVRDTARNGGRAAAKASTTTFLLSANDKRDKRDVTLGTRSVKRLASKKTHTATKTLTVPTRTRPGAYVVLACADTRSKLRESSEKNNCRAATPKLTVRAAAAGGTAPPAPTSPALTTPAPPGPAATATAAPTTSATPAPPDLTAAITGATPPSGSDTASAVLEGTATDATTVTVFRSADCSGAAEGTVGAAEFASAGIVVRVPQGARTSYTARAADGSRASACSAPFEYTESAAAEIEPNDTAAQADIARTQYGVVLGLAPTTLAGSLPVITTTGPGGVTTNRDLDVIRLELGATTGIGLVVTGTGGTCDEASDPFVAIHAAGSPDTPLARNDDRNGALDRCAALAVGLTEGVYYVHVGTEGDEDVAYTLTATEHPGAVPLASQPASPAEDPRPRITGSATPGATVSLFATADCTGTPLATGSAAEFALTGLQIDAAPQALTTVWASATNGPCSASPLRYVNAVPETEPNDARQAPDPRDITDEGLRAGTLSSDPDVFRYVLTARSLVRLSAADATATGCAAPADLQLALLDSAGTPLAIQSTAAAGSCAAIEQQLEPGTYFLRMVNETAPAVSFGYTLRVTIAPQVVFTFSSPLPPGATEAPRMIGTATSGSTVHVYSRADCAGPVRGTGSAAEFAGAGITTSIGPNRYRQLSAKAVRNGVSGPCTAPSPYETTAGRPATTLTESEPNGTRAEADGSLDGDGDVAAGQLASGDLDFFRVVIPGSRGTTLHRFEVLDQSGGDCRLFTSTENLRLAVLSDSDPIPVTLDSDDDSGPGSCPALTVSLVPGTYFVRVSDDDGSATNPYRLLVSKPSLAPPEPESVGSGADNDTPSTAHGLTGTDVAIPGSQQVGDDDWYSVTLTQGVRSLRAEPVEGDVDETCDRSTPSMIPSVELYDATGATLLATGQHPADSCPVLDGTGLDPFSPGAQDLPPGTYKLRVYTLPTSAPERQQYDYRLSVLLR